MTLARDLRTLFHLGLCPIRGRTHADRLESFYARQAEDYDRFRRGLLHGREELYDRLPVPPGGVWIEMGGGTAANLEFLGERRAEIGRIHIVDLSASLLTMAQRRIERHAWTNVTLHQEDVVRFGLSEPADVITFSYSLTMIPDWYLALENARRLLRPGGWIGLVDFYVSRKHPARDHRAHGWWTRNVLPSWFARDNVFLDPDHVPYLHQHFTPVHFREDRARLPYLPLVSAPYYTFVGRA